ncbi:hypothetical protein COO60DRAFT_502323 [Scenedesmus sp. NREL 46B-D3]|nr:hypothetical protein COO60DRAFT_502323 [Scenedesmus sp. NREL 46B-D3]
MLVVDLIPSCSVHFLTRTQVPTDSPELAQHQLPAPCCRQWCNQQPRLARTNRRIQPHTHHHPPNICAAPHVVRQVPQQGLQVSSQRSGRHTTQQLQLRIDAHAGWQRSRSSGRQAAAFSHLAPQAQHRQLEHHLVRRDRLRAPAGECRDLQVGFWSPAGAAAGIGAASSASVWSMDGSGRPVTVTMTWGCTSGCSSSASKPAALAAAAPRPAASTGCCCCCCCGGAAVPARATDGGPGAGPAFAGAVAATVDAHGRSAWHSAPCLANSQLGLSQPPPPPPPPLLLRRCCCCALWLPRIAAARCCAG